MSTANKLMTADELLRLPRGRGVRYELIAGELTKMSPSGHQHSMIGARISRILGNYADAHKLGDVPSSDEGFRLNNDPDTVVSPDSAFISNERLAWITDPAKYFPGAPDLAVEVVSPSDSLKKVVEKAEDWVAAGSKVAWVVHPVRRTVTIYRPNVPPKALQETDVLDVGEVLPGLKIDLADVFKN